MFTCMINSKMSVTVLALLYYFCERSCDNSSMPKVPWLSTTKFLLATQLCKASSYAMRIIKRGSANLDVHEII